MIAGNVPQHLVVGARTGFLTAMRDLTLPWQRIAQVVNLDGRTMDLVDLGGAPMPVLSTTGREVQDFTERSITVAPVDWDIIVWISQNVIDDDRTGTLESRVRGAGVNFQRHLNNRVFQALNAGDTAGFGLCYDGVNFFAATHQDDGAQWAVNQDNEWGLALSLDNFETVRVAVQQFRDDQGVFVGYNHNLLVVPPPLERTAVQITENEWAYDTANRQVNPYDGRVSYIVSPELDATAWFLIAADEAIKPIIVAMRRQPGLQDAWFDPMEPEGGRYYFKFFARYEVYYGDWRTAAMGNT